MRILSTGVRMLVGVGVTAITIIVVRTMMERAPAIEPRANDDGPRRLVVLEPRPVAIRRDWTGFGTAAAVMRADVPARVAAVVSELRPEVDAGAVVRADQLLVRLDDGDFRRQAESIQAAIAQIDAQIAQLSVDTAASESRLRLAQRDLDIAAEDELRVRRAAAAEAANPRELDLAIQRTIAAERTFVAAQADLDGLGPRRAQLDALRAAQSAALNQAEEDMARCLIRSPIDGVVQTVDVRLGESVLVGQRVARVVSLEHIEIPLRLASSARREIAVGDPVTLVDDRRGERFWYAEIVRIAPEDDPATRTMTVYAELRQEPAGRDLLSPGRFLQATVAASVATQRVVVPRRAVRADRVLVVNGGIVRSREVAIDFAVERPLPETGLDDTLWLALREPLVTGDLVVVDAGRAITPGSDAIAVLPDGSEIRAEGRPASGRTPR